MLIECANRCSRSLFPLGSQLHRMQPVKYLLFVVTLLCAVWGCAQQQMGSAAVAVGLCELTKNPAQYAGKRVEVHGQVTQGFENFTIVDERCPSIDNAIWLSYGDQKEHVDYEQRSAAQQIPRTGFARDRESERFEGLLQAFRPFAPDGQLCGVSCSYYTVSATITGWFITGKHHGKGLGGLGHMGCCYLLVMERVSGVTGKRTGVPYGGLYTCKTDQWNLSKAELADLSKSSIPQASGDWRSRRLEFFYKVAAHWHDPEPTGGHVGMVTNSWSSSDLLRQYYFRNDNEGAAVFRQVCRPKPDNTPRVLTSEVLCRAKYWEPPRTDRKNRAQSISAGDRETAARKLISIIPQSVGIPESELLLNSCSDEISSNYDTGGCSFASGDGDVSVWVGLGRTQKRNSKGKYDWNHLPWSAYRVQASVCSE